MQLYPSTSLVNDTIVNDLPNVNGISGARAYPTRPNTRDAVYDKDENYLYIRRTDSNNALISVDRYEYNPAPIPKPEDLFVTKESFNEMKEDLNDVKQSIQQLLSIQQRSSNKSKQRKPKFDNLQTNGGAVSNNESGSNWTQSANVTDDAV